LTAPTPYSWELRIAVNASRAPARRCQHRIDELVMPDPGGGPGTARRRQFGDLPGRRSRGMHGIPVHSESRLRQRQLRIQFLRCPVRCARILSDGVQASGRGRCLLLYSRPRRDRSARRAMSIRQYEQFLRLLRARFELFRFRQCGILPGRLCRRMYPDT